MADYYTLDQLSRKTGLGGSEISELLAKGSFSPTVKHGRHYYSARQLHQLQAALRLAQRRGMSFEEALQVVFAHASRTKEGSAV